MTLTIDNLKSLHPFDATRTRSLMEALCCYLVFVAGITLLSLLTGPLTALIAGGHTGVVVMRLINGLVTGYLGMRILQARGWKEKHWLALIGAAAVFSACGYEVVGLAIVAGMSCDLIKQDQAA